MGRAGPAPLDPAPRGRAHRACGCRPTPTSQPSQVGLVVDSYGLLAVSVARGSAADTLGLEAGDELTLVPLDDDGAPTAARSHGPHVPRHPPAPKAVMRPGTTIVLAILLALILGASVIQLLFLAR